MSAKPPGTNARHNRTHVESAHTIYGSGSVRSEKQSVASMSAASPKQVDEQPRFQEAAMTAQSNVDDDDNHRDYHAVGSKPDRKWACCLVVVILVGLMIILIVAATVYVLCKGASWLQFGEDAANPP